MTNKYNNHDSMDFGADYYEDNGENCDLLDSPINEEPPVKTQKIRIYVAASTGANNSAYSCWIKIDKHKETYTAQGRAKGANQIYECTLNGIVKGLNLAIKKLEDDTCELPREFLVYTNMTIIPTGYYKWRKYWQSKNFTKSGKKMKAHTKWKKLFLLAETYDIKIKTPHKLSTVFKSCRDNANTLANKGK